MKIKLQNVRLSFPALFTPEAFKPGDALKFKATFLIEKGSEQAAAIEKAILETVRAKFGAKDAEKIIASIRGNANKFCYQDGDTKTFDGYEGMMALGAKNSTRPLVIDRDRTPLAEQDGKPYAGCYVKDGDAFAGGKAASEDDFDALDGADADDLV